MPVPLRLFGHCSLHNVKPARCRSCSCVFILPRAKPEAFEICFLSILSVCCRLAVAVVYGTKSWVLRREFCEMNEIAANCCSADAYANRRITFRRIHLISSSKNKLKSI